MAHVFDPRYRALTPRLLRAQPLTRPHALIAFALALASFRSMRFIAEFLLLTAPLLGAGLAALLDTRRAVRTAWAVRPLLLATSVWGASVLPPYVGIGHGASYRDRPHGAGRWLAQHLPDARVFAAMDDGWFLMSELPRGRFIVDGRSRFYGPDYLEYTARAFEEPAEMRRRLTSDRIDAAVFRSSATWRTTRNSRAS